MKPLVLGEDDPPSSVLVRLRDRASADPPAVGFPVRAAGAQRWRWREPGFEIDLPLPRLSAPAQMRNAATAIAALRALDIDIPDRAWVEGVATAHVPGRLQRFPRDGIEVVVDVGHNPQAAREIAAWLRAHPAAGCTHAVYAALAGKDVVGVVSALAELIDTWYLAGIDDAGTRGEPVDVFATACRTPPRQAARASCRWPIALRSRSRSATPGDRILMSVRSIPLPPHCAGCMRRVQKRAWVPAYNSHAFR